MVRRALTWFSFAVALSTSPAQADAAYSVRTLDPHGGYATATLKIAQNGRVLTTVDYFSDIDIRMRSLMSEGNGWITIDDSDQWNVFLARDINSSGTVVGGTGVSRWAGAKQWKDGVLTTLPSPYSQGQAVAVNEAGTIVGEVLRLGTGTVAAMWQDGSFHELPLAAGFRTAVAIDINDQGHILGEAYYDDGSTKSRHHVQWIDGQFVDFGTLPEGVNLIAMNDGGQVIAHGFLKDEGRDGSFLIEGSTYTRLPQLPDTYGATVSAINDAGVIVGSLGAEAPYGGIGVIWKDGEVIPLADLVDRPDWAYALPMSINDAGEIAVSVIDVNGAHYTAVLTPVPEPTALALICGGLGVLALARARGAGASNRRSALAK